MLHFPTRVLIAPLLLICLSCLNQKQADGQVNTPLTGAGDARKNFRDNCEDCDWMFAGMPDTILSSDTTAGWYNEGQRLVVSGKVLKHDGKTAAPGVILYYYHTDRNGHYSPQDDTPAQARRHGYLRGWVKTNPLGEYAIFTSRPAQYPGGQFEAHIHVYVKEPDMVHPYWIDAWIFDDDPLVTEALISRLEKRGGSGLLSTHSENGIQVARHDIILGLNVPGYPK